VSFTDACVVAQLSHQSGVSRQSLTVRTVCGTSSHANYQTDLQHLRSLMGKSSSNWSISQKRTPYFTI